MRDSFDRNGDFVNDTVLATKPLDPELVRATEIERMKKNVSDSMRKDPERWEDGYRNHTASALRQSVLQAKVVFNGGHTEPPTGI